MDKQVYKIVKFDLKGKVIYTYKLMSELEAVVEQDKYNQSKTKFYYKGTKREYGYSHLWELTTSIASYKNIYNEDENEFLPYFADVTEDLPGWVKLEPKTYRNCQLMSEKHGGYLQFYHKPTKEVLRIAMNSNTYQPVTNQLSLT